MDIPIIVPLKPSLRKRFYEALVLWFCLKETFTVGEQTEVTERISDDEQLSGRKQLHRCFVNKMAQICATKKDSDTVTALGIIQPGETRYIFASNKRSEEELDDLQEFIEDILNTLGAAQHEEVKDAINNKQSALFSDILRKILRFNRPRLQHYIRKVAGGVEACIESVQESEEGGSIEAQEAVANLERLIPLVQFAGSGGSDKKAKGDDSEFVHKTEELLSVLEGCYRSSLEEFVRQQHLHERERQRGETTWDTMHHATGRLMSYFYAVGIFLKERRIHPEIFSNFSVECVRSSVTGDTPDIRKKVDGIVSRLTPDKSIHERFRKLEPRLQQWGLNDKIKSCTHPKVFQPIVHAELLVDDFIRREQRREGSDDEPIPYFREKEFGRYIGSSKPPCKLCAMYFAEHPDGVQVRPTHDNVYYKWRAPDVFESDPEWVLTERTAVLEAMVKGLRGAIVRCIKNESAVRNPFDSNNTPSDPIRDVSVTTMFAGMSVRGESVGGSSRDTTPDD
ncbi:hypothetical protein QBC39DRAFT_363963 [Podospora conica]|nr:hypothetical protein QBC39DRAFT_363963 [Schizothecium conicum]